MLTLQTHKETPLELLSEEKINALLNSLCSSHISTKKDQNLLALTFTNTKIILPLMSYMTWGHLQDSLKEKGLINETN